MNHVADGGTSASETLVVMLMMLWLQASSSSANVIIAEVDINNQLPACRNNLTRSSTQDEVISQLHWFQQQRDDVKGYTCLPS